MDIMRLAYSIERLSDHLLARSIIEKAEDLRIEALDVDNFACLIGSGVSANVEGRTVYAGKPEFFEGLGLKIPKIREIERLRRNGKTVVLIGTSDGVEGIMGIRDEIRPNARVVIEELHEMGIKAVMLTGDCGTVARSISEELGMDEIMTNLKPDEKTNAVEELERRYGAIAMVGDGINDAPALAKATVGIAMGTAGGDAAIEAADVALMADDLTRIPFAINIGMRARKIGGQNIVFALLVLMIMIPSALIGILSIAAAVFLHEGSEILAVLNGLRVARK